MSQDLDPNTKRFAEGAIFIVAAAAVALMAFLAWVTWRVSP